MLHDRRPILTTLADKVAVRDVVAKRVGEEYLTRAYQVHGQVADIDWEALPTEFVAKVSHASGGAIIVTESAQVGQALPERLVPGHGRLIVHPDSFDSARAEEVLAKWLSIPYGWAGRKREWAYRHVQARVLIEELLRGSDGAIPEDYKFMMFDGVCGWIQVDVGRHGDHRRDLFTPDWERLPVDFVYPRSEAPVPVPERLGEMMSVAASLAAGHDFLRVDLYAVPGRVVFGELTAYPEAGRGTFEPPEYDRILGELWHVPRRYD